MKKDIFAVCDRESSYTLRLTEYIQKKQGAAFEVHAFTTVESLCEFAKHQELSLLLLSAQLMSKEIQNLKIHKIMILSEGECLEETIEFPHVYKYQSSDGLIAEVMDYYAVEKKTDAMPLFKKNKQRIAVYSPARHLWQTAFSLTLGQVLSKNQRVLYVNMESCAGLSELLGREERTDLSDLMYFVRRDSGSLVYKLQGIVQTVDHLDYIPPAISPIDIRSITCEEWMKLFGEIEKYSTYETMILDLDETAHEYLEILKQCDVLYMPVSKDPVSEAKIRQYEKFIKLAQYEELLEKTKKLELPFGNPCDICEDPMEQMMWYVSQLLREEETDGGIETKAASKTDGEDGACEWNYR